MTIRLYVDVPLQAGSRIELPPAAARHAQVRRVQPGDELLLFDGSGPEWTAEVLAVGRSAVLVQLGAATNPQRESPWPLTLALGMPANERMDWLVEKATELGVARIQPLVCERSVLRLAGERAERKRGHWQGIAAAACEQSGRTRLPQVEPVLALRAWLDQGAFEGRRLLLTPGAPALSEVLAQPGPLCALSGPEGGLDPGEQQAAMAAGFEAVGLGPRVLRADTSPIALLAWMAAFEN